MKAGRCQATAASGKPCAATPRPGRPYCLWHDPEAETLRRELSRQGGKARSNAARAKKELPAALTSDDLLVTLSRSIHKAERGELEPGVVNCISGAARAMNEIRKSAEIEQRLSELEARAGLGSDRWRA